MKRYSCELCSAVEELGKICEDVKRLRHDVPRNYLDPMVKLSVGGKEFVTTVSTLSKEDSMLRRLVSTYWNQSASFCCESLFVDRDAAHFQKILNYLRTGTFIWEDMTLVEMREMLLESEYYQLNSLSGVLYDMIEKKEREYCDLWMECTDQSKGFRVLSSCPSIAFAVSRIPLFDPCYCYQPPKGWRWATKKEFLEQVGEDKYEYPYWNQSGWNNYEWEGVIREAFLFSDSLQIGEWKHAGDPHLHSLDRGPISSIQSFDGSRFAGIVCIKQ